MTVKGHGGGRNVGDLCRGPHDLRKAIVAIGEQPRLRPLVDLGHMVHTHHLLTSCGVNRAVDDHVVEPLADIGSVDLVTNVACDDSVHCQGASPQQSQYDDEPALSRQTGAS